MSIHNISQPRPQTTRLFAVHPQMSFAKTVALSLLIRYKIQRVIRSRCRLACSTTLFFRCVHTIRVHDTRSECCSVCTHRSFSSSKYINCYTPSRASLSNSVHFMFKEYIKGFKKNKLNSIDLPYFALKFCQLSFVHKIHFVNDD